MGGADSANAPGKIRLGGWEGSDTKGLSIYLQDK